MGRVGEYFGIVKATRGSSTPGKRGSKRITVS